MASSSTRRPPSRGRAAGAGLLAPDRPAQPAIVQGALLREAHASVALDHGDVSTYSLDAPAAASPDDEETVEREEVTVEPDLPVDEPAPSPAGPAPAGRAQYDAMVAAMPPDEPVYVAGTRAPRLKVGAYVLQPGDVVPGAHGWPRREAYERLGRIERR